MIRPAQQLLAMCGGRVVSPLVPYPGYALSTVSSVLSGTVTFFRAFSTSSLRSLASISWFPTNCIGRVGRVEIEAPPLLSQELP